MDLNALLTAQSDAYGRIARSVTNLKKMGAENITLHAVETRLQLLDKTWAKVEAQHEAIRTLFKEEFDESEYNRTQFFDTIEITYVEERSALNEYLIKLQSANPSSAVPSKESSNVSSVSALPRLRVKSFSGAFEDWPTFRDSFMSIVGKNKSISNIEKYHHLRYSLEGAAEKLIRPLAVIGENYPRAWAMLKEHYENEKEVARANFAAFTAVPKMRSDTTEELDRVFNAVTSVVSGQEGIGRPIETHGFDLLNHLVTEMFDPKTRLEWASYTSESTDVPSHETLVKFITRRAFTLKVAKATTAKTSGDPPRSARSHHAKGSPTSSQCVLCKGKHNVMMCDEFKAKSATDRKTVAETHRLCFNCLGPHQIAKCQSAKTCTTCKARHHSMLHDAYATVRPAEASTLSAVRRDEDTKAILLATARVNLADRHGTPHTVRALIDQGSEVSLISESLVQRLRLPRSKSSVSIFGIGGTRTGSSRGKVSLSLSSTVNETKLTAVAFILPRLSLYQGAVVRDRAAWPHVEGLQLADPGFRANDPIELLLGAEVCSIILEEGLRKGGPQAPVAQRTSLGWILSGGCVDPPLLTSRTSLQCTAEHELTALVRRFWEQEQEASAPVAATPEEQLCEDIFTRSHTRTDTGRYMVRLPFASI
ncbi:PREDICTED: uncharacterized protein LOC105557075 [Vollenhovia emeryi]|uniref:uncharacterized protein LOC105557075 n=1 Tax=Vollenhovia emeryi TaxID=411798 RepID=UPI0005F3BFA1|nr:PREDICTED: uncharacterized protein LOC105557075 [Vollenhovia emeryi]